MEFLSSMVKRGTGPSETGGLKVSTGVGATWCSVQLNGCVDPAQTSELGSSVCHDFVSANDSFDHLDGCFGDGVLLVHVWCAGRKLDALFQTE